MHMGDKFQLQVGVLVLLLAAVGVVPAYARFTPVVCQSNVTPEQEIAVGQKAAQQVYQQMPVLPDSSPVAVYVRQLGAKLVQHAPGYRWPFNFHVVNSADINAFAVPGGAIFVNLGTVQAAETEAQLAGVMAHEASHVVQRHSICNMASEQRKSIWYGLGSIASAVLLGNGAAGGLAQTGIGALQGLDYLHMSRNDEKQADLLGTDILYDSGYDPRAMPQFFEIIESKYGKGGAQLLSDHPNPGNRIDYVNEEILSLPPKTNYVKTTTDFTRMHAEAMALHAYTGKEIAAGTWKRNGQSAPASSATQATPVTPTASVLNASVYRPQGTWQRLNQPQFTTTYPSNWQATQGPGTSVTIAPQGGEVNIPGTNNSAVAYGVVMDTLQLQQQDANAGDPAVLDQATQQLMSNLKQENGLSALGGIGDIRVNGQPGKSQEFQGKSPVRKNGVPQREHDWVVTILRPDGNLNYIVFVAPEQDFGTLKPVYVQMLREFRAQ